MALSLLLPPNNAGTLQVASVLPFRQLHLSAGTSAGGGSWAGRGRGRSVTETAIWRWLPGPWRLRLRGCGAVERAATTGQRAAAPGRTVAAGRHGGRCEKKSCAHGAAVGTSITQGQQWALQLHRGSSGHFNYTGILQASPSTSIVLQCSCS